ncbi:hypothetical protein MTO96_039958 [Rhipicephalus appendiculatus]
MVYSEVRGIKEFRWERADATLRVEPGKQPLFLRGQEAYHVFPQAPTCWRARYLGDCHFVSIAASSDVSLPNHRRHQHH